MSVAIWRIWIKFFNTKILKIYFYHLFFNSIWSVIFFGFHLPFLALIDLLIIILFVIYLAKAYKDLDASSFYLTIPYIIWILYAFVLNLSIVILNN